MCMEGFGKGHEDLLIGGLQLSGRRANNSTFSSSFFHFIHILCVSEGLSIKTDPRT